MYFRSLKDHPNWQEASKIIFDLLDQDMVALINEIFPAPFPLADVFLNGNEVIVFLELPGWREQDEIILSAGDAFLEIRGNRTTQQDISREAGCISQESFRGPFNRTAELPCKIDPENFSVKYINGILEIHFRRIPGE